MADTNSTSVSAFASGTCRRERLTDPGDVGGQKTLRSYWKNYFEKTDTLIWVVDATDRLRVDDCREELAGLLLEEVRTSRSPQAAANLECGKSNLELILFISQRLMGATLLVFLNKTDVEQCMTEQEVREVSLCALFILLVQLNQAHESG